MHMNMQTHGRQAMVTEASKTTNFLAYFYKVLQYCLKKPIDQYSIFWQVYSRQVKKQSKQPPLQPVINLAIGIIFL